MLLLLISVILIPILLLLELIKLYNVSLIVLYNLILSFFNSINIILIFTLLFELLFELLLSNKYLSLKYLSIKLLIDNIYSLYKL